MAEKSPEYMHDANGFYNETIEHINDAQLLMGDEQNRGDVTRAFEKFRVEGEAVIRGVRPYWRDTARKRIGKMGIQLITEMTDADNRGDIIPPFTDQDREVLAKRREEFTNLLERAEPKESNKPTPTKGKTTSGSKR